MGRQPNPETQSKAQALLARLAREEPSVVLTKEERDALLARPNLSQETIDELLSMEVRDV